MPRVKKERPSTSSAIDRPLVCWRNHTRSLVRIRLRVEGNDFRVTKHRFRRISVAVCGYTTTLLFPSLRNKEAEARESAVHTLSTHREPGFKRFVAFTEEFQVAPKGPWNARGWKFYASGKDLGMPSRFPTVTTVFSSSTTTRVYTHTWRVLHPSHPSDDNA